MNSDRRSGDQQTPDSELARGGAVLAAGSVVSRLTGFARSAVVVAALGSGLLGDAYNLANTIPNILYILLIGGALNAVFVPQLVRSAAHDADGGQAYAQRLLTATTVALLAVTALAVAAAPYVIALYADYSGAQRTLAVTFARYCLPEIFFYGLFTMLSQVLNAQGRFGPSAWAPVLNNLVIILTFGLYLAVAGEVREADQLSLDTARLLGLATTLGVAVQALTLIPPLRAAGLRLRPRFDWRGTGVGKALRLAVWMVLLVLVNQVGYWVVTRLSTRVAVLADAAGVGPGVGYTAYSSAYLLWITPHGVITVSLLTALMPRISRAAAAGEPAQVRAELLDALRMSSALIMPAAFGFLALGPQIATVVFLHGQMTVPDTVAIGHILMAFSLGLVPFSAQYLLVRTLYVFEDTRTPFQLSLVIMLITAAGAVTSYALLPLRWATTGMAAGYALTYAAGLWFTAQALRRRVGDLGRAEILRWHARLGAAGGLAGLAAGGAGLASIRLLGTGLTGSSVGTVTGAAALLTVYRLAARRLGIHEVGQLFVLLRRGRFRAPVSPRSPPR